MAIRTFDRNLLSFCIVAALASAFASPASAQQATAQADDEPTTLDRMVVTA